MTTLLPKEVVDEFVAGVALKEDAAMLRGGIVPAPDAMPVLPHLRKAVMLIEKASDGEGDSINRNFSATISTSDIDRDGDIIDVEGWKLKEFIKNPVLLFAHDTRRVIGGVDEVSASGKKLNAKFHVNTDIPLGLEVATLLNAKDLRATSVGIAPLKLHSIVQGKEEGCERCLAHKGVMHSGFFRQSVHMQEQSLMELSIVAIPANAGALVRMKDAASRLTLDGGAHELLDFDVQAVNESRLDSLERRIDALALQAGDVKVLTTLEETGDEGGGVLFSASVAYEKIRRALRQ